MTEADNANVTPEGVQVKPGQVWMDLDKRSDGRTVKVLSVENGKALVDSGTIKTRISIRRMKRGSTGWALVRDVRNR